jgi:hypothetical protein
MSCSRVGMNLYSSSIRFFIDGTEITSDTITIALNSYQEIRIESYSPRIEDVILYYWQYPTGYPQAMSMSETPEMFRLLTQSFDDDLIVDEMNGYTEAALFYTRFSDEIYHSGDLCKLRVQFASGYYERVLNIKVE